MLDGIHEDHSPKPHESLIPRVKLSFPRPVTSLHSIELESRCNLVCKYCPSKDLQRPKQSMPEEVFVRALEHVKYYVKLGTQKEVNVASLGEATLHENFVEYVCRVREAVGWGVTIIFATNGITAAKPGGEEMVKALAAFRPQVFVSLHRPELAGLAVPLYKKYGLLYGVSADAAINGNSWAGQVDWPETSISAMACGWQRQGLAVAMSDGRISACCLDASGIGVIGHVNDEVGSLKTRPYALCLTCHHHIKCEGFDQKDPKNYEGMPRSRLPLAKREA